MIALVISIIVMLILAGVSINAVVGEQGILTQTLKASFVEEMTALKESVDLKRVTLLMDGAEESKDNPLFEDEIGNDFSNMPLTLIAEIMYTRNGMDAGTGKDAAEILKENKEKMRVENYKLFAGNSKSLYYIDEETAHGNRETYVYDAQTMISYKITPTSFGGHTFHSLTWYDIVVNNDMTFVENGLVMATGISSVTTTDAEGNTVVTNAYEPNMTGFTPSKTYMVYYNQSGDAQFKSLSEYIDQNRPRVFDGGNESESSYVLYNYANKYWANIKCVGKNEKGIEMETWWTWIPRYAYKIDFDTKKADVVFVNTSNKVIDASGQAVDLPAGYTVHSAFSQDGRELTGIWVSKYPPSKNDSSEKSIAPDFTGFAGAGEGTSTESSTYVLAFSADGRYYVEIPLDTYETIFRDFTDDNYEIRKIKVQSSSGDNITNLVTNLKKFAQNNHLTEDAIGTNLTSVTTFASSDADKGEEFYIYNYNKKIWANCKTVNSSNNATSYWVWIPRYAYNLQDKTTEVIFVDTEDMPVDGEEIYGLPSMYTVHSAFNQNGTKLRGIWVAKYPASSSGYAEVVTTNFAKPDMNDETIQEALNNADIVTITYYSEDGRRTSTTNYNISVLGSSGAYSLSGVSETKSLTSSYGDNMTYSMYRYNMGVPFQISIRNAETKQSRTYTWWPRYADKGNERIYLESTATAPSGYTIGTDFNGNTKSGVWK